MLALDTLRYYRSYKKENEESFSPFLSLFAFKNLTAWGEGKNGGLEIKTVINHGKFCKISSQSSVLFVGLSERPASPKSRI